MLKIGMVGIGGISSVHLDAYTQLADRAKIVARCDKIPERANGTAEGLTINIGGPSTVKIDAKAYTDYRELVLDPDIDVVDVTLPTDLHADAAIAALEAGKNVISEKPMARTMEQCDRMIAAAKASGRTLMVAHCIRFWPEYEYLKELVDSGKYGKVTSAFFSRLSEKPIWSSENWLMDPKRSGGSILDLHVHDTDYITYLFGMPKAVSTRGRENEEGIGYAFTQYQYDNNVEVMAEGGWDYPAKFPFRMTFRVRFEGAVVEWDAARAPLTIYPYDGEQIVPEVSTEMGYLREIRYFLDCVARNEQPTTVKPNDARESVRIILAETESLRSGKPVAL